MAPREVRERAHRTRRQGHTGRGGAPWSFAALACLFLVVNLRTGQGQGQDAVDRWATSNPADETTVIRYMDELWGAGSQHREKQRVREATDDAAAKEKHSDGGKKQSEDEPAAAGGGPL